MAAKAAVIGIDLGSSDSLVAYVGKGIVDIVQNEVGKLMFEYAPLHLIQPSAFNPTGHVPRPLYASAASNSGSNFRDRFAFEE